MAGTGSNVRAGGAFIEIFIKDPTVQASLENIKHKLRTFGESVNAVGTQSFVPMASTATGSLVATGASVGVLAATMGVLRSSVYAVGNAIRVTFNIITASVSRAVVTLVAVGTAIHRLLPATSKWKIYFDKFLSNGDLMEKVGGWGRFIAKLTGSKTLFDFATKLQRLGLASNVVAGFQRGIVSGIGATFGAAFRSAKSVVMSGIVSLFSAPIAVVRGMVGSAFRLGGDGGGGAGALASMASSTGGITSGLTRAGVAARTFSATSSMISRVAVAMRGVMLRAAGMAAAISGPALLAAKNFVTSAESIVAASQKVGEGYVSIADGIRAKFGAGSMISESDIRAAADLGNAMKALRQATAAAWAQIGAAALPILRSITERMTWLMQTITVVIAKNRDLVTTVVKVAGSIGAAAAAGLALYTVFPYVAGAIGLLLSPMGLLVAGVAAAVIAFPQLRAAAMDAIGALSERFSLLGGIVNETMGGIADALQGGNIQAAVRVLWAGVKLIWLEGTNEIRQVWRNLQYGLSVGFINLGYGLQEIFTKAFNFVADKWEWLSNMFAKGIAAIKATINGWDVSKVLETLEAEQGEASVRNQNEREKSLRSLEENRLETLKNNEEDAIAKEKIARDKLKAARDEFKAAREAAAKLKTSIPTPNISRTLGSVAFAAMGSFSTAGIGRQGVAGLSQIEDATRETADNTAEIARTIRDMGVEFA